jgi:hypothetical protein
MTESSRSPVIAICSVRGIGVAVSVSMCTSARSCFSRSLCVDPEALFLVDDDEPEILEFGALGEDRMRADDDVELPLASRSRVFLRSLAGTRRAEPADLDREAGEAL